MVVKQDLWQRSNERLGKLHRALLRAYSGDTAGSRDSVVNANRSSIAARTA
jgi:hypothetical protein